MKRALRLALKIVAGALLLAAAFLGYVYWMFHPPSDRADLYSRALEEAVAAHADAGTPARFSEVMDFETPVNERPPGADPAAFVGTGPAILPCRRTVAMMRFSGPGECTAVHPDWTGLKGPAICRITACTVLSVYAEQWADPAFRAAVKDPALRDRLCALRGPPHPMGWVRDSTGLMDCGPWWRARGLGFVSVLTGDRTFEYHRLF